MKLNRKRNKLPPFVALTWEILNSAAYKRLPASAAKALPYFLGKVKKSYGDPQRYLSEFSFSYTEAQKLSFAVATHYRVIESLMAYGFIDPIDKGGLRGLSRNYNLFRLSTRWKFFGTSEFQEMKWRCFQPQLDSKVNTIFEKRTAPKMRKKRRQ